MKESKGKYTLELTCSDLKVIEERTDDIEKTLATFRPQFIKGKVILKVSDGKKTLERVIFAPAARRLFYNKLAIQYYARNLERGFI